MLQLQYNGSLFYSSLEKKKKVFKQTKHLSDLLWSSQRHTDDLYLEDLCCDLLCSNFMEFQISLHVYMYICYFPVHWLFKSTSIWLYNENYYCVFFPLICTQTTCMVDFHLFNKIPIKNGDSTVPDCINNKKWAGRGTL